MANYVNFIKKASLPQSPVNGVFYWLEDGSLYFGGQLLTSASSIAELVKKVGDLETKDTELAGAISTLSTELANYKTEVGNTYATKAELTPVSEKANANEAAIAAINNAETGILAQAKADAKAKADAVQGNVDALAAKVGEVAEDKTVMGIIAELDGEVDTLAQTHATDKAALEGAIALKADQTALDAVSAVANAAVAKADYDVKVKALEDEDARIAGLVAAETERATGVEGGFETRIAAIEEDHLVEADKTALQEQITANANAITALTDGIDPNKIDGVKDLIDYVDKHGATVEGLQEDIDANADAISAMDTAYKAADATLQGNIDTLSGVVDTKAAASDVEALTGRVSTAEGAITTLQGEDTAIKGRLDAIEAKFGEGEGSVADLIAAAEERAAEDAKSKADAAESAAKTYADGLNTAMDTRVDALETASATHATKEELGAVDEKVEAIKGDYLKAADKTELEGKIAEKVAISDYNTKVGEIEGAIALKADQTALDTTNGNVTANANNIASILALLDWDVE